MPVSIWNVDWLNANSQRKYPLADEATALDTTGSITLPNNFLVDMVLSIPVMAGVDPGAFHLMTLVVTPQGVMLTFGHDGEVLGTCSVNKATHVRYNPYRITGGGDFYDAYGTATIDSFDGIDQLPAGMYTFDVSSGRLIPTVIQPDIRGVSSLRIVNGSTASDPLTGDVYLVAGRNTRFQVAGNQVTVDALPLTESLAEDCGCEDQGAAAPCIKTVSGVAPNALGDLLLEGMQCIEVGAGDAKVTLTDKCSEPCCGCDELKVVLDTLAMLQSDSVTITSQMIQLDGVITQMGSTLSMSTLPRTAKACPPTNDSP